MAPPKAGLSSVKKESRSKSLIPDPQTLATLSLQKIKVILETIDRENDRQLQYAKNSLIAGIAFVTICLLVSAYSAFKGHETYAGVIFGIGVLAFTLNVIRQRL